MDASCPKPRGRLPIPFFVLLGAFLIGTPLAVAGARQLTSSNTSPATGHAQVVTQGIATFQADQVAWRLVERTARPRYLAIPSRRTFGFILASEEPVLLSNVTDSGLKNVGSLAPGEAMMVPADVRTVRASLGDKSTKYLALELVPADQVDDVGSGKLLFKSDAFNTPQGERDMDLVRNVLAVGESSTVPDTGQSNVVLATEGAIDVVPNNGRATRLEVGESGTFTGDLTIKAVQPSGASTGAVSALTAFLAQDQSSNASYVVAVIGAEIPPPTTPTPTTTATETTAASSTAAAQVLATQTAISVLTATSAPGVVTDTPTNVPNVIPPTATNTAVRQVNTPTNVPTDIPTDTPTNAATATHTPTEEQGPIGNLLDSDGDGLTDVEEILCKTNPHNPDSDNNGINDRDQCYGKDSRLDTGFGVGASLPQANCGSSVNPSPTTTESQAASPIVPSEPTPTPTAAPKDSDSDGLSDAEEALWGTNPQIPDSDRDGLLDGDEVHKYFTQPTSRDSDGDGETDGDEVDCGSDPLDETSRCANSG
jgi:hypothetical protein